jgi:hypothetical protein
VTIDGIRHVALATVGFGDLTPTTDGGKLFTIIYIFMGIGVLVGVATKMMQGLVSIHPRVVDRLHY